jgi:hypothetical protein
VSSEALTLAHRYVLEAPIASGGMATVWRARDDVLARSIAVKILHPHLAEDPDFLRRFRHEALAAARLAHPNIVAIYDSGSQPDEQHGERHYVVMEYCAAGTLAERLRSGPVDPDQAVGVGVTICDALVYAHSVGIIHRDVKPSNVLLAEDGTIKVADFGIAKAAFAAGDISIAGTVLGTVTYMAPEQIVGLEPDARSDLYSLGVLIYELLAGRPPFIEDSQLATALAHQYNSPPPLRSLRVGIPRPIDGAVMRALAKDPSARWASAAEMRAALADGVGRDEPTGVLPAPRPQPQEAPIEAGAPGRMSEYLKLAPVILFVAIAVVLAFVLPGLLEGPDGTRGRARPSAADDEPPARAGGDASRPLVVQSVRDFDPYAGDGEHPEDAGFAVDGRGATAWTTSTYNIPLSEFKPGVGLILDLGRERAVREVRITSGTPGFALELRAGSTRPGTEQDLEVVDKLAGVQAHTDLRFDPVSARYWVVWITSLPGGGGGHAAINEVEFLGA